MGVYLSKPIMDKESADFDGKLLKCGASSMQGWRVSQEDAHNCCLDFDVETSLFAVYDGHGGHEVAEYASKHLPDFIKQNEAYKAGDFNLALVDAFLKFDASLKTESIMEELGRIAKEGKQKNKDGPGTSSGDVADSDDETDVAKLREEASIPIADVIAMYANNIGLPPKTPKNKLLGLGSSKPMSPFLRAVKPGSSSSKDSEVSSSSGPSSSLSNGVAEAVGSSSQPETSPSCSATASSGPETSEKEAPESSNSSGQEASSNGEVDGTASSSSAPEVSSSSTSNSDDVGSSTSKDEPASSSKPNKEGSLRKKTNLSTILDSTIHPSDDEDSSNDEPFQPNEEVASSTDDDEEDVQVNGTKDSEEEDEEDCEDDEEECEEDSDEEEDDEEVDEDYEDFVVKGPEEPGMDSGCTAVVALVTKDKLYVANAGDSRAVLCRGGTAVDLSVDHKPEDPLELKRIQNAGGKVTNDGRVNGGLNLSRALGDHFYKRSAELDAKEQMITALPDVVTETIDRSVDEFIVLACDGIWNSMSSQEVVDFVRPLLKKGETLSSICEKLFEACLAPDTCGDGTGCDNMTCVIVKLLPLDTEAVTNNKRRSPEPDEPSETEPNSKKPRLSESES